MAAHKDEWVIGVDLGTGSCKCVIIDTRARILGFGTADYAMASAPTKWKEQDPEALVDAMLRSVRTTMGQAGVSPRACRGMSIGGALHSLMAVDKSGRPTTGIMTWLDARALEQASAVRDDPGAPRLYGQTGCPAHSMYPLYKLIWMREKHPDIFHRSARFVSAKEYVIYRLTGQFRVDYSIASGSGLLDVHQLKWHPASLQLAGVTTDQLSPLAGPRSVVGELKPAFASKMGIPADAPLVLGSSDAVNSSLGAGAVRLEYATCMIGTSGAFRIIARRPLLDASGRSWCYAIDDTHWLVGGAINNGGIVLAWLRQLLNDKNSARPGKENLSYDDLVQMAAQVDPGADGLICLPFFAGERSPHWNMNSRGVFFGLTLDHDLRHMVRALLEGVAFRLRSVAEVLNDLGCEIHQVRASGGWTRSEVWPRIVASALGTELQVPRWGETSCLGAALWALLGTGAINRFAEIEDLIPLTHSYPPVLEEVQKYDRLFTIYKALYSAVGPSFEEITRFSG